MNYPSVIYWYFKFQATFEMSALVYYTPLNSDRRYFFPAEILIVRHHNLPVIKILPFHSKKHISHRAMNPQVKPKGKE